MKIYGKKTVITDCEWELEDQPDLKKKLESKEKTDSNSPIETKKEEEPKKKRFSLFKKKKKK